MNKEQATALVLSCMHEVASTEARFAKEAQENDAYLGGPLFVRAPRTLSDAEVIEIVERRLQTIPDSKQAAETVPTAETERADIVDWLHKEAITRSHNVGRVLKEIAGLIKIDYHHWTTK